MRRPLEPPTIDELRLIAEAHGIDRLGVAPADRFESGLVAIEDRKRRGLDGGLGFTFRNPERATNPRADMPEARSVLVAARSYALDAPLPPSATCARVGKYAWVDHYGELRRGLKAIARRLKSADHRAVVYSDDNRLVDREAAHRAGLGWFGKNANLLVEGLGSWFVLGAVVTTQRFEHAEPVADGCGTCTRCLTACPTGAIVAPGVIDANRCLAWVIQKPGSIPVELRAPIGDRIYGCDDCQDACPPTVRLSRRSPGRIPDGAEISAWVDVLDLLDAEDQALLDRHGRWYIADRSPRWLRRNALVVLGNIGDHADSRTRVTLQRYAAGRDELLAEHAQWALGRLDVERADAGRGVAVAVTAR